MDDRRFVEAALKRANRDVNGDKVGEITRGKTQKWREIVEKELPLFDGIQNFVEKMSREFALGIVSMVVDPEENEGQFSRSGLICIYF